MDWLSQFPHERERILPPWTHLEVVSVTLREDGVTVVKMKPTIFQNVRTVEEVADARREEIKAHISGLVIDLRNEVGLGFDVLHLRPSGTDANLYSPSPLLTLTLTHPNPYYP